MGNVDAWRSPCAERNDNDNYDQHQNQQHPGSPFAQASHAITSSRLLKKKRNIATPARNSKKPARKTAKAAKAPKTTKAASSSSAPSSAPPVFRATKPLPPGIKAIFSKRKAARRENGLRTQRTFTARENHAWRTRPYGCHSFEEAMRIYEEKQRFDNLPPNSFLRLEAHKPASFYPEWCYRGEHPLKTGRKRVLYHRSDYITPIIDSMTDLYDTGADVFGISIMLSRQRKRQKAQDQQAKLQSSVNANELGNVLCTECGNQSTSKMITTKEGLVCNCGVVCGRNFVSANRQKLGALQEDDKTVVADAPQQHGRDQYDFGPQTTEEARKSRLALGKTGSGGIGGKRVGKGLGRLCDAQKQCELTASQEIIQRQVANGIALHPRDRIKQRSVMRELESIFKSTELTSHPIKRAIRIRTDKVYMKSVQHSYRCMNANCQARLSDRHASSIASVCAKYEVDRLVQLFHDDDQHDDLNQIDLQTLKDIQLRIRRSTFFATCLPNSQFISCFQTVTTIDSSSFDYASECITQSVESSDKVEEKEEVNDSKKKEEEKQEEKKRTAVDKFKAASSSSASSSSLASLDFPSISSVNRCNSLVSNGSASPSPSKKIEIRDAILTVFLAHRSKLKTAAKDDSMKTLQDDRFAQSIGMDETLALFDASQIAYCLLYALSGESAFNLKLAAKVGLTLEQAGSGCDALKKITSDLGIGNSATAVKNEEFNTADEAPSTSFPSFADLFD